MKFVMVLVEGQTEETFITTVLAPTYPHIQFTPIVNNTSRKPKGDKIRGGGIRFSSIKKHIGNLLNDSSVNLVTTMLDYHQLPKDFAGYTPKLTNPVEHAIQIEQALEAEIGAQERFKAYLSVHDFEALLFSDVAAIAEHVPGNSPHTARMLQNVLGRYADPEHINGNQPPARHLSAHVRGYSKIIHGIPIAQKIGLPKIRAACPHFNDWLSRLDSLAVGQSEAQRG
jgi:hypothetical protein